MVHSKLQHLKFDFSLRFEDRTGHLEFQNVCPPWDGTGTFVPWLQARDPLDWEQLSPPMGLACRVQHDYIFVPKP